MDLSVIYPVHITFQTRYILERLQTCLINTHSGLPDAEHIIILSGSKHYVRKAQATLEQLNINARVILDKHPANPYSPGIARNRAVKHSTKNHLLFWDIDLLGSPQLFQAIPSHIAEIRNNPKAFHMYPCMYLCKEYSKHFKQNFEQLWNDATTLKVNTLEHFAMATSTILCNKQHFLEIGAFDEDFVGHMGEDLELLNRLAKNSKRYLIPNDYHKDTPNKVPNKQTGFRRHFAEYSLPHIENKTFTVHLHHSTGLGSSYKKNNAKNRSKLIEKIKTAPNTKKQKLSTLPSYLCMQPIVTYNRRQVWYKKLRKLVVNPKKFFRDI